MLNVLRDEEIMPSVKEKMMHYRFYLDAARETLLKGRRLRRGATIELMLPWVMRSPSRPGAHWVWNNGWTMPRAWN